MKCRTIFLLWLVLAVPLQAAPIYVDADASGANNGSSWANAYNYLQDALTEAAANDEIWIAEGEYRPDQSNANPGGTGDANETFTLKNLVAIYGGFCGGETSKDQRTGDCQTILSGDLQQNDDPCTPVADLLNDPCRADNSYHVVYGYNCGAPTRLDMLTIKGGNANGPDSNSNGGGMYNYENSSSTLNKCTFEENAAKDEGGGMYSTHALSSPSLTECDFIHNGASYGGGMSIASNSHPTLTDCTFTENFASNGGGMYNNWGYPTLNICSFGGNSATEGGGMYNSDSDPPLTGCNFSENSASYGGGMYNTSNSKPTLSDCEFTKNSAVEGGGMYNDHSSSELWVIDCLFNQNEADDYGGGMCNHTASPTLIGCLFCGNSANTRGGGMLNRAWSPGGDSRPHLINCVFSNNFVVDIGSDGGAIANNGYDSPFSYDYDSSPILRNCTLRGNFAEGSGGGMHSNYLSLCEPDLANCILWGNADTGGVNQDESAQIHGGTVTVTYTCIQGCSTYCADPCNHNMGDDPLFVDPLGPDYLPGTPDDNLRIIGNSPCIDAGDNNSIPAGVTTDFDGNPRRFDIGTIPDSGNGIPPIVDMGAFERYQEGPFECGDYFHPYPTYDFNKDCRVNFVDLTFFATQWLECSAPEGD